MKPILQILSVILIDIISYTVSLYLSCELRAVVLPKIIPDLSPFLFTFPYAIKFFWMPALFVFFIAYERLYTTRLPFWDENKKLAKSITLSVLVIMTIVTLGKMSDSVSRLVLLSLWITSLIIFPIFRLWGKKILYKIGVCKERVLILGAGNAGRLVLKWIQRERHIGYDVIGFLDDDPGKTGAFVEDKKVFGKIRHFPKFVKEFGVQTIIIATPSLAATPLSKIVGDVQKHVRHTILVPELYGIALLNTELLHLFYEEIFLLNIQNNLKSFTNRLIKRAFDLSIGILLLPFLLMLTAIIGILIKLETPGPVIYSHNRIGSKGRQFKCYKFRTMHKDSEEILQQLIESNSVARKEWEQYWKITDDPRVTRIGKFLRKTSLDELPQIFNVLKGEMSLIGPRPYLIREKSAIEDKLDIITSVPPGITGLWQVSGRSNTTYPYRIRLDMWYIMNWSLWLDIFIILKTFKVVLGMKDVK
ncbi:UDP-glucose:undecaprenyl-phosphate glucose-1-phosphate transferase [bacterium BMS3Bbin06]|nr:UDP-glucose:undecaprenyl-phosphate glucose-1-phosphate transferase [bacterium BMS3Abin08]GBE34983.1 UDP-glucose:undecaprenyl-phosphate glucose-1-phosphate transferase [bacterium BMS3Bbin06]